VFPWLTILSIAQPMMKLQHGVLFHIAWSLWRKKQKKVRFIILSYFHQSLKSQPHGCLVIVPDWRRFKRCVENNISCYARMPFPFMDDTVFRTVVLTVFVPRPLKVIVLCFKHNCPWHEIFSCKVRVLLVNLLIKLFMLQSA